MVRLGKPGFINLAEEQIESMVCYVKERGDILAFYMYGSYGTEYQTIFSDVDLAVVPLPGNDLDLDKLLTITAELSSIGKSDDINLIDLQKVPVTLQMKVLDGGKLLYCADDVLLSDFIESVILHYSDFEPDLRSFYRDYDYGLKKEYQ